MDSLYQKLGGAPAVARLAFDFYDRVLASERLAPYFAGIDMARLVGHQATFIGALMGGPMAAPMAAPLADHALAEAHAHLAIDGAAFDEMAGLLRDCLVAAGLAPAETEVVMAAVRARRPLIVREPADAPMLP